MQGLFSILIATALQTLQVLRIERATEIESRLAQGSHALAQFKLEAASFGVFPLAEPDTIRLLGFGHRFEPSRVVPPGFDKLPQRFIALGHTNKIASIEGMARRNFKVFYPTLAHTLFINNQMLCKLCTKNMASNKFLYPLPALESLLSCLHGNAH